MKDTTTSFSHAVEYRFEPPHARRIAAAMWGTILSVCALLTIVSFAAGGYLLLNALALAPQEGAVVQAPKPQFAPEDLRRVVEGIEARAARYEALKAVPPDAKEPRSVDRASLGR